jgi:hypothetical protein
VRAPGCCAPLTGALFGVAAVYLAYPYVEDAMQEVLESELLRQAATSTRHDAEASSIGAR